MKQAEKRERWAIGGHDAAALFNANPYSSPLKVWAEKTGRLKPPDLSQNKAVQRGHELEGHLINLYSKLVSPVKPPRERFQHHRNIPRAVAVLDGRAKVPLDLETGEFTRGWCPLDAKTVSRFKRSAWGPPVEDDPTRATKVPIDYQIQLQHYMWICGSDAAGFSVGVVNDHDYRRVELADGSVAFVGLEAWLYATILRNSDFISVLEQRVKQMIEWIETDTRPPVNPHPNDIEVLREILGPEQDDLTIDLGDEGARHVAVVHQCAGEIERFEAIKAKHEAELMSMLDEATVGLIPADNGKTKRVKFQFTKPTEREVFVGAGTLRERLEASDPVVREKDCRVIKCSKDELEGWVAALKPRKGQPKRTLRLPRREKA